jgi:hypothetical protein
MRGNEGQAAVETAIVMPMNVFLLLGLIQFGLIAQARVMAKFAAYRAVRVGAMQHADRDKMRTAALFTLAPVLSTTYQSYGKTSPVKGAEIIGDSSDGNKLAAKWSKLRTEDTEMQSSLQLHYVDVEVCGPLKNDLSGEDIQQLNNNLGDQNEVDFDDPRVATEDGEYAQSVKGFKKFMRTKLRIQVQLNYRMPIPFANWIISSAMLGSELPQVLRMDDRPNATQNKSIYRFYQVLSANQKGVYLVPINVSYAMRMQSNFDMNALPTQNNCAHYNPS